MSEEVISRDSAESIAQKIVTDETVKLVEIESSLLKQIGSVTIYEIEGVILYMDFNTSSFIAQINAYSGDLVGLKYLNIRRYGGRQTVEENDPYSEIPTIKKIMKEKGYLE